MFIHVCVSQTAHQSTVVRLQWEFLIIWQDYVLVAMIADYKKFRINPSEAHDDVLVIGYILCIKLMCCKLQHSR